MGERPKEEQVAMLNQQLQKLGYATLGELVGGLADGVITNKQLVEELADALSDRIVNRLLTTSPEQRLQPQAMKSARSPGFEPGLQAWRVDLAVHRVHCASAGNHSSCVGI